MQRSTGLKFRRTGRSGRGISTRLARHCRVSQFRCVRPHNPHNQHQQKNNDPRLAVWLGGDFLFIVLLYNVLLPCYRVYAYYKVGCCVIWICNIKRSAFINICILTVNYARKNSWIAAAAYISRYIETYRIGIIISSRRYFPLKIDCVGRKSYR
ncbi:hypothetical protein SAMN04487895_101137 [Paenibacillus sophorae]|uniref:Uncharacterized protein n=1 Tax=Paenibacillus sophorae TaxID=1333845 RepID=A0A1H8FJ35_9BACL|nr:hypothetical protein SAMN04487895_101137 [Paenibacillus sophorae]